MRVRCISQSPTNAPTVERDPQFWPTTDYRVEIGEEYFVASIWVLSSSVGPGWGPGAVLEILSEIGRLDTVPLSMFEIVDGKLPSEWELRVISADTALIAPPLLFTEYFHDRLSDGEPSAIREFNALILQMERE